jgi:hypothetical protein
MDKWLRLHLVKRFVNLAVRVLNRMIPRTEPTQPQTKALAEIYKNMYKAFSVETYCGTFDDVPGQKIALLKDRNFLHVLEFSEKLLTYLGEMDRYYRSWLGLALLLANDKVQAELSTLDYEETMASIYRQWQVPLKDGVPIDLFDEYRRDFLNVDFAGTVWSKTQFKFGKKLFK